MLSCLRKWRWYVWPIKMRHVVETRIAVAVLTAFIHAPFFINSPPKFYESFSHILLPILLGHSITTNVKETTTTDTPASLCLFKAFVFHMYTEFWLLPTIFGLCCFVWLLCTVLIFHSESLSCSLLCTDPVWHMQDYLSQRLAPCGDASVSRC